MTVLILNALNLSGQMILAICHGSNTSIGA
jgi:hypothetical protein